MKLIRQGNSKQLFKIANQQKNRTEQLSTCYTAVLQSMCKGSKGLMEFGQKDHGDENFNPRPKGREGERGILFLDNPGASVTKISSDPLQPSDKYHKVWPLSILSLPSTS